MSEERFEKYNEVMQSLIVESISCTPSSWKSGTLTIDCDGTRIDYKLKNKDDENKAQLTDNLRSLCEELYVTMRDSGDEWIQAGIHFFEEDGAWKSKTNFRYDDPAPAPVITSVKDEEDKWAAPQKQRDENEPWWKFW